MKGSTCGAFRSVFPNHEFTKKVPSKVPNTWHNELYTRFRSTGNVLRAAG